MGLIQEYRAHRALRDLGLTFGSTRKLHKRLLGCGMTNMAIIDAARDLKKRHLSEAEMVAEIRGWGLAASEALTDSALGKLGVSPEKRAGVVGYMRGQHAQINAMHGICSRCGHEAISHSGQRGCTDCLLDDSDICVPEAAKAAAERAIEGEMNTYCRLCPHTMFYHQSGRCIVLCDGRECGCDKRRGIGE